MQHREIWWFNVGPPESKKFIRMTFKKFDVDEALQCNVFSIRTFGALKVALTVESSEKGEPSARFLISHLMRKTPSFKIAIRIFFNDSK